MPFLFLRTMWTVARTRTAIAVKSPSSFTADDPMRHPRRRRDPCWEDEGYVDAKPAFATTIILRYRAKLFVVARYPFFESSIEQAHISRKSRRQCAWKWVSINKVQPLRGGTLALCDNSDIRLGKDNFVLSAPEESRHLKSCDGPPQVRKLIGADVAEPCPGTTSYQNARPVTVRICGRKELERTCPPKLCDCPPKRPMLSRRDIVGASSKLIAKGAIAGGLVYWTSAEGLWGDSSETEDLYYRIVETVAPVLPELPDLDEMKLPHLDSIKHTVLEAYNHFVCSAIGGLVEIPAAIKNKIVDSIFPMVTDEQSSDGSEKAERSNKSKEKDGNI